MKQNINFNSLEQKRILLLFTLLSFLFVSCKKYLDARPDKKLVVPTTLVDAQALLDNFAAMNELFPVVGNESDDNFYFLDSYFNTIAVRFKGAVIWEKDFLLDPEWNYLYIKVNNANIALETIDNQPNYIRLSPEAENIRGQAYFFRAIAFYNLVQYYARPYEKSTAGELPGIPIRLRSDISQETTRETIEKSWQQIVSDLKNAIARLYVVNNPLTRPSKTAAYAALANVYLDMDEYELAELYADSSLILNNTLLDFNSLDDQIRFPFRQFNEEVLFHSRTSNAVFSFINYRIDSLLYKSYSDNDLRRKLYFISNGPGTFGFRGSYDGPSSVSVSFPFNGIATDMVYLIKAECAARNGSKEIAMEYLNRLLETRWTTGTFAPFTAASNIEALEIILEERRKELILRSTRWFDLRRLNKDPKFAKTLVRIQNGITYTLPPGDNRYVFLIPSAAITIAGIEQNTR